MARNNRQPRRTNHPSSVKLLQRPDNGLGAFAYASVDAFLMFDENLNLVSINPAGERMFGVSKEMVAGKNIVNLEPGIRETKKYGKYLDVMKTGGLFFVEEPFAHPKFGDMHLSIKAFKVREGLGMIVNDITERRQAEDALKESEQRFKAIFDNAVDGITLADPESKKFYTCNKMFSQMLGYSLEEINNLGIADIHPDKDLPYVMQQFEKLVRQEISLAKDIPTKRRDDSIFYADINSSLITVAGKSYIIGIFRDITERKKAEEALRESELLATATIEGMPDGVMLVGMDGKVAYVNKAFEKMLGYEIEELVGTSAVELPTYSGSKDRKKARQALKRVIEKGSAEPIDMIALSKDGMEIPINFSASVIKDAKGNPKTLVAVIRDVTERRKAEEALQQSELNYRVLFDSTLDGLFVIDAETMRVVLANESGMRMAKIYGFDSLADLNIADMAELFHPEDRDRVIKIIAEDMFEKDLRQINEFRMLTKDGREMWISAVGTRTKYQGKTAGLVSMRDITEHKQMEEMLRRSEEKLRLYLDNSPDAVYILDAMGNFLYGNIAAERVIGYPREEIVGRNFVELGILSDEQLLKAAQLHELNLAGKPTGPQEYEVTRKDGSLVFVEISTYPTGEGDKLEVIGIARDITERRIAEEALRASEEKLRLMFESITDGIVVTDSNGVIIEANSGAVQLGGFSSREAILGRSAFELIAPRYHEKAAVNLQKTLEQRSAMNLEYTLIRADGSEYPGELSAALLEDASGNPVGFVGIVRDITERRRMEEEVRRLSDAVKMTSESIAIVDLKGRIVDINEAGLKMYGLDDRADLVGKDPFNIIVPEDQPKALENMSKIVETGSVKDIEYHIIRKDGKKVLIETSVSLIRGEKGEPKDIVAVARDITERRWMEEALRYSEEYFRSLIENAQDAIVIVASDGTISYGSPSIERMLGYKPEELISADALFGFAHPDDIPSVVDTFTNFTKSGNAAARMELRIRHKDGSWRVVEAVANNLLENQAIRGIVVNWRDVTERKRSEEALRASEARYRLLAENVKDVISAIDMNLHPTYVSPSITQLLGYTVEETMAMSLEEGMTPASFEKVTKAFSEGLAAEERGDKSLPASLVLEAEAKHKDGHLVPIEMRVNLLRDIEGKPMGILGVSRDITERKKAEEALKSSEERYRLVVENANEFIVVAQDGMVKFFNSKVVGLLGYTREDLALKPFTDFIHPDDRQIVMERYLKRIVGRSSPHLYSFRVVDKTGNARWVEINAVVFMWEGRPATLNFLTDITERKKAEEEKQRMEEQLLLAGRLAVVGELSAGVAHELNNPIAAIQGFAQLLAGRNDLDDTTKKDLSTIYREAQRAAKITQNLLSFARRHEPEKQLILINEVVEKTLELQAYQMKVNNIELVVDFAADLPKTMADFFQMQQVFVNLINNAEQAMVGAHGKGRLVVKTQQVGNMIQISFADDGPGIPEENMKRIFDPFFTTKEVGKGTGLGLSICYGIVEAHGGRIYARSKLGEGATFVVEIPIVLVEKQG